MLSPWSVRSGESPRTVYTITGNSLDASIEQNVSLNRAGSVKRNRALRNPSWPGDRDSPTKAEYICADQLANVTFRLQKGGGPYIYSATSRCSRGVTWSILLQRVHSLTLVPTANVTPAVRRIAEYCRSLETHPCAVISPAESSALRHQGHRPCCIRCRRPWSCWYPDQLTPKPDPVGWGCRCGRSLPRP